MVDTTMIPATGRPPITPSPRLRIAHVTATFPPYWAGTGNVAYHNSLELARRGHDVTVFTAECGAAPVDPLPGVEVRRLPTLVRFGNAPVLPQLLGLRHFDVIHLHHPFIFGAEMVSALAKLRGIPYVLTHHNDLIGDGARRRLFDLYSSTLARPVLSGARKFAVVSLDHASNCRHAAFFRRRWSDVVAVPNGVDTSKFQPGRDGSEVRQRHRIPADAGLVLFVGALDRAHHFKGVPHLLATLPAIRERNAVLLIVGDGDQRTSFAQLANQLGIADRVRFAGAVQHRNLAEYYAAADVVVLPSFPPESFGLVLIEAMACGKPVVAQDIPGVRAVVDHGANGFLVTPSDEADLAAKVNGLLADPGQRTRMGAAGRSKVERQYEWRTIGEQLERLYLEAMR